MNTSRVDEGEEWRFMFAATATGMTRRPRDWTMMPTPPVTPFLLGLAVGPLVVKTAKPILRGAVKAVVVLGFEARKLAVQVSEEVQDIASETAAESITEDAAVVPPRAKR